MTTNCVAAHQPVTVLTAPHHLTVTLKDGGTVRLRPLGNGEIVPQLEVLAAMSDHSRWQRFLGAMPAGRSAPVARALADVDGQRHVAWAAEDDTGAVGVARWVRVADTVAEVAFEVADAHHARGIGTLLLEAIAVVAADRGVARLTATVHPGNDASVRLLAGVGLLLCEHDGLLEGTSDLVVPAHGHLDRVAVLALALDETELRRGVDHGATVGQTQLGEHG